MSSTKEIIERWNKTKNRKPAFKRRKYITISVIAAVCLAAVLVGLFLFTDVLVRPVKSISVVTGPGEWSMFGRDLSHSGAVDPGTTIPQGIVKTVLTTGGAIDSSPAISNGIIYVGSRDGNLYAIDESTGAKLWAFQTGSWVESSPAIVNNVVYFGSNDGHLYALNAKTGQKIWSFYTKYPVKSSPAVADGKVFFGCDDYSVYAVNATTGKEVWRFATSDAVDSSPAVANGIVFVGTLDGNFYAIDARSGRQRLIFPTNVSISSSPVVSGTTVYFTTAENTLYALNGNARNWFGESKLREPWLVLHLYGDLPAPPLPSGYLWSVDLGDITAPYSSIANGYLYTGSGKKVISVNLQSHAIQWEFTTGGQVSSVAELSNNAVYAVSNNGHLYVLNASTGEKLRDIPVGGAIVSAPVMANGTVYISSQDGNLYAVK